jgi:folate-dependent phosphoribosylglycinamide formyltransferase PurN
MRITVFTSNQPRHVALIEALARVADEVLAVQECSTVFPGRVEDFYRHSPVMQDYFSRVIAAEAEVFGRPRFAPANVRHLPIRMGDVNQLEIDALSTALSADFFVVFGASFIRGPLCDLLVSRRAVNIHMGVSPHYRGSGTNFWAMYDRRPDLVGATIHLLTRGLDSGPMLFHALPPAEAVDPFVHGMRAVRAAHVALAHHLRQGTLLTLESASQDKSRQIRYSRHADFTDQVASEYLGRLPTPAEMRAALSRRDMSQFHCPQVA